MPRAHEWIEGLTRITDVTGRVTRRGRAIPRGSAPMRSPSAVLQVDRPNLVRTRFGVLVQPGRCTASVASLAEGTS